MPASTIQLGKNIRAQVGVGATPTYTNVNGEQSIAFKTSPDKIDASSKDDGDYKISFYGQMDIAITITGKAKLPDTALAAVETARKTLGGTVPVQLVDTSSANAVKFAAVCSVGAFQVDYSDKDAVSYSIELSLAAAPTTDSLFGG